MLEPRATGSIRWQRTFQHLLLTVPTRLFVPVARSFPALHRVELLVSGMRSGLERRTLVAGTCLTLERVRGAFG
jgi:hypothetical protein